MSAVRSVSHQSGPSAELAHALLLGLHGLSLLVVFPLGPQEARLWHPGVAGAGALAAAFPLAAFLAGRLAGRLPRLPVSPRGLAVLALIGALPAVFSTGYQTLFFARAWAGAATGIAFTALRRMPSATPGRHAALAPRVVAFGAPLCILAATCLDWRAAFAPIALGYAALALLAPSASAMTPATPVEPATPHPPEPSPAGVLATAALASVSGAYLTVLSGYLVFNAGHTEFHTPVALLLGALLGLTVPPALAALRRRLAPTGVLTVALAGSALGLVSLLALRQPIPAVVAIGLLGAFLATSAARHLALAGVVAPALNDQTRPTHQFNTHLAHHLGAGLGALGVGLLVSLTAAAHFMGMPGLLAAGLAATGVALAAGIAAAQPTTSPAARAAWANNRWRVAASFVRSVRTSMTRTPGSPT